MKKRLLSIFLILLSVLLSSCGTREMQPYYDIVSASPYHIAVIRDDHTVLAIGNNDEGECEVDDWEDIVKVYATDFATIGITRSGDVKVAGIIKSGYIILGNNEKSYLNIDMNDFYGKFKDITDLSIIATGSIIPSNLKVIGLKKDGTCVIFETFKNEKTLQAEQITSTWNNLIAVGAYYEGYFGVTSDGVVHCVQFELENEEMVAKDVTLKVDFKITNCYFVSASYELSIVGLILTDTGEVYSTHHYRELRITTAEEEAKELLTDMSKSLANRYLKEYSNIRDIATCHNYIVLLRDNGTVFIPQINILEQTMLTEKDKEIMQLNEELSTWKDIIDIAVAGWHVIGIKSDGTIMTAKNSSVSDNFQKHFGDQEEELLNAKVYTGE